MLRVLVTGFEPFGGAARNPSGEAARALQGARLALPAEGPGAPTTLQLAGAVLPVSWARAVPALDRALAAARPHAVLATGMAAATYRVERWADDVRVATPDEDGRLPEPVRPSRTLRRGSALPVDEIEAALRALGCPVEPSEDAGGYLCNHVFLALMERAEPRGLSHAGFLHVPAVEPAGAPPVHDAVLAAVRVVGLAAARFRATPTPGRRTRE